MIPNKFLNQINLLALLPNQKKENDTFFLLKISFHEVF